MEDSENNTSAINAILDISENLNECSRKLTEKERLSSEDTAKEIYSVEKNVTIKSSIILDSEKPHSLNKLLWNVPDLKMSEQHSTSSSRIISLEADSTGGSHDNVDVNYTSDCSDITSIQSKREMTAWEKWFVGKQEIQRERVRKKYKEMQQQGILEQKKKKEREACIRCWLERKKIDIQRREVMKDAKADGMIKEIHTFEQWVLKKSQQKEVDHLRREYMEKKEEEEKKEKEKQNEEAIKRWMAKAKLKFFTPKMSYAIKGESTVCFYDSTRPPPPSFINPEPWRNPC